MSTEVLLLLLSQALFTCAYVEVDLDWQAIKTRPEIFGENKNCKTKICLKMGSVADEQIFRFPILDLVSYIARKYLLGCHTLILTDDYFEQNENNLVRSLLVYYPLGYINGRIINRKNVSKIENAKLLDPPEGYCRNLLLLLTKVDEIYDLIGDQLHSKVIVVTSSKKKSIQEYLRTPAARRIINLLIIYNPVQEKVKRLNWFNEYPDLTMYTHCLFANSTGESDSSVVTAWRQGKLTNSDANLFPTKRVDNFHGMNISIAIAEQPPFVVRRNLSQSTVPIMTWDGLEVRFIDVLSDILNFSSVFKEPKDSLEGKYSASLTQQMLLANEADLAISGIYITPETSSQLLMSSMHSQDCASFISLASIALPKYRAIMGPFRWTVWAALTAVYMGAILPLHFTHTHTLMALIKSPKRIEQMFWWVFGTFTNCFTFSGRDTWQTSKKNATRVLVGFYWAFTIMISACYTGSIIAFVTLPAYPEVVDTSKIIYEQGYRVGMLGIGSWPIWFQNSSDPIANKLLQRMEYLPSIYAGLQNVTSYTSRFLWSYAFLGSHEFLEYIVRVNFTQGSSKRSLLHIGKECFVLFNVGLGFPQNSHLREIFNIYLLRALQSGIILKLRREVDFELLRSKNGRLLSVTPSSGFSSLRPAELEDRMLTLDDVQGTFLLLGAGFAIATLTLILEILKHRVSRFLEKRQKRINGELNPNQVEEELADSPINDIETIASVSKHLGESVDPDDSGRYMRSKYQAPFLLPHLHSN